MVLGALAIAIGVFTDAHAASYGEKWDSVFTEDSTFNFLQESQSETNWAQPQVGCVEDFTPQNLTCLDLTRLENPITDLPNGLTQAQIQYWTVDHKADLQLCRAQEVQRREAQTPGTFRPLQVEITWMTVNGAQNINDKVSRIYAEAQSVEMPPQILYGAIRQESLLADLGIASDGGNYSCGLAQTNIIEWCHSVMTMSRQTRKELSWPKNLDCNTLTANMIEPFYNIALTQLNGLPTYRLNSTHFSGVTFENVEGQLPDATTDLKRKWFLAAKSFINHCSDYRYGIAIKAKTLKRIYDTYVPQALKQIENYPQGQTFNRACQQNYTVSAYPLKTAWLLADSIYNAGPRVVGLLNYYFWMTPQTEFMRWVSLNPLRLVEGIYWGGTFNASTGGLDYVDIQERARTISWRKTCVAQQHISKVIGHVTLPGQNIAAPLNPVACSEPVPVSRRNSTGRQ